MGVIAQSTRSNSVHVWGPLDKRVFSSFRCATYKNNSLAAGLELPIDSIGESSNWSCNKGEGSAMNAPMHSHTPFVGIGTSTAVIEVMHSHTPFVGLHKHSCG